MSDAMRDITDILDKIKQMVIDHDQNCDYHVGTYSMIDNAVAYGYSISLYEDSDHRSVEVKLVKGVLKIYLYLILKIQLLVVMFINLKELII